MPDDASQLARPKSQRRGISVRPRPMARGWHTTNRFVSGSPSYRRTAWRPSARCVPPRSHLNIWCRGRASRSFPRAIFVAVAGIRETESNRRHPRVSLNP